MNEKRAGQNAEFRMYTYHDRYYTKIESSIYHLDKLHEDYINIKTNR